ncbi:ribosome maturation factor RimM [Jeotgalibacillus haloalkalitolerans]|uniref:Ribosome maturation factor RimM n=1 Tax=Jeotgalibacillus haloalkalitolerans TaxID=3104292 RepID=A0ABU5KKB2_9BACL|nr:ribosome maturation factor RimM [Jeotgalibacillus sp. HH7-29]MDZ5711697.1 ribosome maturation factor RimM [Jeotgalibacillus sp. HH7-29]
MEWFDVGKIVNTHGIKGEVRVISSTDFPEERYKKGNKLYLFQSGKDPLELSVSGYRRHKNFDLLTFEGYDNVNLVEPFRDAQLKVSADQQNELGEDEYYYHEIIGCEVFSEEGERIGSITEILSPGANDVWVIKPDTGKDVLIPYIESVVKEVNVTEKKVIIHKMEGLLE